MLIARAKIITRLAITLIGGTAQPIDCRGQILRHVLPLSQQRTKQTLGGRFALPGSFLQPRHSCCRRTFGPATLKIKIADRFLRPRIAPFGHFEP